MVNPALQLDRLTIGYGGSAVVHEVTLEVPKGAAIALLGPNGAGKSTLLRAAAGLLKPMSGRIVLDGEDVTRDRVDERTRRGLCHIPDGRGVFPSLTVRENIVLQSDRGQHEEALHQATEAFPALGSRLKQLAGTLSGGEQQMLALSRAYVSDPRVVLVDEVSLGLAPVIVDQLFEFLASLLARGTALLIVEQYVSRALGIAAEVYVLSRGRIVLRAPSSEVSEADLFERYLNIETQPA
jgi:branched-chain amino acid transport system ATP-binding protein